MVKLNSKALLVSTQTYATLEQVFGSLENGADAPINAMLTHWLNNNENADAEIKLRQNVPLNTVNLSRVESATVTLFQHQKYVVPVTVNREPPSWSSLSVWLVEHVFLTEKGNACILLDTDNVPRGYKRIIDLPGDDHRIKRMFQSGGAAFVTKDSVDSPTPRGWMTIEKSRLALRGSSAMQSMRLIRHIINHLDEMTTMTVRIAWANRPGAIHAGRKGRISFTNHMNKESAGELNDLTAMEQE